MSVTLPSEVNVALNRLYGLREKLRHVQMEQVDKAAVISNIEMKLPQYEGADERSEDYARLVRMRDKLRYTIEEMQDLKRNEVRLKSEIEHERDLFQAICDFCEI